MAAQSFIARRVLAAAGAVVLHALLGASPASAVIQGALVAPLDATTTPSAASRAGASTVLFQSAGGNICSAVIVGPNALMTAANCVSTSKKVLAEWGGETYSLECGRLSRPDEPFVDIALCASGAAFKSGKPARMDLSKPPALGESLMLVGYGCTTPGGLDRSVGRLSAGTARVSALQTDLFKEPLSVLSGAAACQGDAGAGVYRVDSSAPDPVLVGVLSRSDMAQTSYMVPLAAALPAGLIRRWNDSAARPLCGAGGDPSACAGVAAIAGAPAGKTVVLRFPEASGPVSATGADGQLVKAQGAGGESVADAFQRVCGVPYKSLAGMSAARAEAAASTRAAAGEILQLPNCPITRAASVAKVKTLQPGETVWSMFQSLKGASQAASAPAASKKEFADYAKAFVRLNPNAGALTALQPNTVVTVPPLVSAPGAAVPAATAATAATVATLPPQAIPILSLSAADADATCNKPIPPGHPYDLGLLLDVIALNRRSEMAPVTTGITIADSGLLGAGSGVFSKRVLSKGAGTDFVAYSASIAPLVVKEDARMHGTMVASVALGGPLFARFTSAFQIQPIQLAVQRIYFTPAGQVAASLDSVTADVGRFDELITIADSRDASIVNLSLRSTVKIPAIETNGGGPSRLLFVAAAGNQGKKLSDDPAIDTETTWPALYGGAKSGRVITVLALDLEGKRAAFSNWGDHFVDIAAPGCKIPALTWDGDLGRFRETTASGTSLSAPLVAFAAALVRSESAGTSNPALIKRRLLVSADLAPQLIQRSEVADSRRLNIVKAAAVRNDLVEAGGRLMLGEARFVQGENIVRDDDTLVFSCDLEADLRIKRSNLLKFAKWLPAQDGSLRFRIYFQRSATDLFNSDTCTVPANFRVEIRKTTDEVVPLPWADVQDIVLKM